MSDHWRHLLDLAYDRQKDRPDARWVQLATLRPDGRPANRTLVFRGFLDHSNTLQFTTDTRSTKASQVLQSPWAAACWYLPETREQFRLSGPLELIRADSADISKREARRRVWEGLSLTARETFAWPEPGAPRAVASRFEVSPPDPSEPLPSFGLLLLDPEEVDYLDLRPTPHLRKFFSRSGADWTSQDRNP